MLDKVCTASDRKLAYRPGLGYSTANHWKARQEPGSLVKNSGFSVPELEQKAGY